MLGSSNFMMNHVVDVVFIFKIASQISNGYEDYFKPAKFKVKFLLRR